MAVEEGLSLLKCIISQFIPLTFVKDIPDIQKLMFADVSKIYQVYITFGCFGL